MNPAMNKRPMRFQKRDALILQAIQDYGGVLAKRHIQDLFWRGKSERAMQNRLSKLQSGGYLEWPSIEQRKLYPIPEPIAWLGWKGAMQIASQHNLKVDSPKAINENQLRGLELALRKMDFRWLREPRWSQLTHDLTLIDVRLKIEYDVARMKDVIISHWINETDFRVDFDQVSFSYKDRHGNVRQKKRGVIPDGYFCLVDQKRASQALPAKAHFFVEVDMATHDNPSFGIEKVAVGAAYIHSRAFASRFGSNNGRWLIITTGEVRMKNLMAHTLQRAGKDSGLFFFSTFTELFSHHCFEDQMWSVCDSTDKQILLPRKE